MEAGHIVDPTQREAGHYPKGAADLYPFREEASEVTHALDCKEWGLK
jgi:hypothetical protein